MQDSVREVWFADRGWTFRYVPEVPLSRIVLDKVTSVQIRLGEEYDAKHVGRLALAYQTHAAGMPAVVLVEREDGYAVADGIHRILGARHAEVPTIDAYVVTNADTDKQLELLRRSANAIGGKGFDAEQAVLQAVALCDAGWSTTEAALVMNVSDSSVSKMIRARAIIPQIEKVLNIPRMTAETVLSRDALDALGRIQHPELFKIAAEIAYKGHMTSQEIRQLVDEARASLTDDDVSRLILQWRQFYRKELTQAIKTKHELRAAKQIRDAPRARLDRALTRIKSTLTYTRNNIEGTKLDDDGRQSAVELLRWVGGEYLALADAIATGRSPSRSRLASTRTKRVGAVVRRRSHGGA